MEPEQKWRSLDWQLLGEFRLSPDCGYLADLCIAATHRREGIASKLVRHRWQQYLDKPMPMLLRVSECKADEIALYQKLGFTRLPGLEQLPEYRQQDGSLKTKPKLFMVRDAVSSSG